HRRPTPWPVLGPRLGFLATASSLSAAIRDMSRTAAFRRTSRSSRGGYRAPCCGALPCGIVPHPLPPPPTAANAEPVGKSNQFGRRFFPRLPTLEGRRPRPPAKQGSRHPGSLVPTSGRPCRARWRRAIVQRTGRERQPKGPPTRWRGDGERETGLGI